MLTSAHIVIHPEIFPAFGCAPLIPPKPEVKNILPKGLVPILRNAFKTVIVVP